MVRHPLSTFNRMGLFLILSMSAACDFGKPKPNTGNPEDKVLFDLGQALAANDKKTALTLYDLEFRQRMDLWDQTLKSVQNQDKQAELLKANEPRLGDAAALVTTGSEAWAEVQGQPWAEELASGKCVSGPPSKDDLGRGVVPKEDPKKMNQDVGAFVFNLRTMVNWSPVFRVNCPKGGTTFWVQLAQRKKTDPAQEPPLRIVRIMK